MKSKENLTLNGENKGVSVANSQLNQQLTKIKGTLTSQIRKREETSPYYYAFVKLKGHGADLPVVFKVKNLEEPNNFVEPKLKKGNLVQLTGHYSNSDKNIRKSFTCSAYELLAHE
jgi:hypothetical protein